MIPFLCHFTKNDMARFLKGKSEDPRTFQIREKSNVLYKSDLLVGKEDGERRCEGEDGGEVKGHVNVLLWQINFQLYNY